MNIPPPLASPPDPASRDHALREAAVKLEAGFLKQMLSAAGLGRAPEGMGGGAGEDQFSSFLLDEQAMHMARAGGIGLAESLFKALQAHDAR